MSKTWNALVLPSKGVFILDNDFHARDIDGQTSAVKFTDIAIDMVVLGPQC